MSTENLHDFLASIPDDLGPQTPEEAVEAVQSVRAMTPQPMTLEETIARLRNGPIDTTIERSALHHLEAGKRAECSCDAFQKAIDSGWLWRSERSTQNADLSHFSFCPWCGGTLPTHEQKGQG